MTTHSFSLDEFIKANEKMAGISKNAYGDRYSISSRYFGSVGTKKYTAEEVQKTIDSGTAIAQAQLSRTFFASNGYYKRILLHYGTLLKYAGLLIPNPVFGQSLQKTHNSKAYYQAMDYLEQMDIPNFATRVAMRVLIDGSYYGIIQSKGKTNFSVLDLPFKYCRSQFRDREGKDIIEFNVSYFENITDKDQLAAALTLFPKEIVDYYRGWLTKRGNPWVFLPVDKSVYFELLESRPLFLQIIPAVLEYNDTVAREAERELEEIKKIIVQKIPHLSDGQLLFEPVEAKEIHRGSVDMLRESNPNTSILTTYADVDVITSNASAENLSRNNIEKMKGHIYGETGATPQVFATTGNIAAELSLKNDLALMMVLGNHLSKFFSDIITKLFGKKNMRFKYTILPISWYNERDFVSEAYKLVNSGYSILLPAVAQGLSQKDFYNLKVLENDLLNITDLLIPPRSSATGGGASGEVGRPTLPTEEKSEKTIRNIETGGN